jgi:N-acetylneuraminic acid mutarotase
MGGVGLFVAVVAHAASPAHWERRASMGVPRQEVGVAAIGDTLYAVGGFAGNLPSAVVEAYDTASDRWTGAAPLPVALHHVMVAATGGVLYAAGGLGAPTASGASDATFAYDPATNAWTARAPLPRPRGAGAAAVIDGLVYVAGGLRGDSSVRDLAVYDPLGDAWTELAPMPTARDHLAAGAIDGRLYVVGGRNGGVLFDVVEVFDPTMGSWSAGRARMPTARGGLGAAALHGLLYAFGGEGNPDSPFGTFPQAEAYDAARDAWTPLPDMGVPRHGIGVAAVGDALYVMGGATRQGLGPSGAGEVFLPGSGEVLSIRRLSAAGRRRLALRGRLVAAGDVDPASTAVRFELDGGEATALPAGSLVARPGGRRWRLGSSAQRTGFRRFDVRRLGSGDLAVRVAVVGDALPRPGVQATVTVVIAGRAFTGSARVHRGR